MIEIEEGSRNIYADLQTADAEVMYVKAQLVNKIDDIIRQRNLTLQQAAEILGVNPSGLSEILRGRFRNINEIKLMEYLNYLGSNVDIIIRDSLNNHGQGHTQVLYG